MELKLFGKKIFEFRKSSSEVFLYNSTQSLEKSKFLPDFYSFRENRNSAYEGVLELVESTGSTTANTQSIGLNPITGEVVSPPKEKPSNSPKKVYELKLLNDESFKMNVDKLYIEDQLQQFKDKLNLIKITEFDVSRGTNEIASILIRLENRKKYEKVRSFFEDFAYTTTAKITEVINKHSNLQMGKIEQFIADMPKEAVDVMKAYTKTTEEISKKKPIFYIIADKKDFKQTDKRRDPILLVQSPFGHFWQILGAWDEEMMFLEEL